MHDGGLGSGRADVLHRRRWQRLGRGPQSQVGPGNSVQLVSAYGQGALYATNAIDIDTTSQFDGPLDGSTVKLGQSTSSSFPGLSFVPAGMPGNPDVYAEPQPPQLYSG